jgi:hypothetical protein
MAAMMSDKQRAMTKQALAAPALCQTAPSDAGDNLDNGPDATDIDDVMPTIRTLSALRAGRLKTGA